VEHFYSLFDDIAIGLVVTHDNNYIFISTGKILRQLRIKDRKIMRDYKFAETMYLPGDFGGRPTHIHSMVVTFDSEFLFVGCRNGSFYRINISRQKVDKHIDYYGDQIGQNPRDLITLIAIRTVNIMAVTRDNKWLIAVLTGGEIYKVSIQSGKLLQKIPHVSLSIIKTMWIGPDDKSCFVFDNSCNLRFIDLANGDIIKDFGNVHTAPATFNQRMLLVSNKEHLFTANDWGELKQFSVRNRALVHNFGFVIAGIRPLCY
jgi:hypothetical protein